MKMRKKLAALLAAAMIASVMPMTAFAASTNRVTQIAVVADDKGTDRPVLKMELKDGLKKDDVFYLKLDNAKWDAYVNPSTVTGSPLTIHKISDTEVEVKANRDIAASEEEVANIILKTKNIKGEATVEVNAWDAAITDGKYIFARSSAAKSIITIGDVPSFYTGTSKIAKFTIEEAAINALKGNPKLTFILDNDDFEFVSGTAKFSKGLSDATDQDKVDFTIKNKDEQVIGVDFSDVDFDDVTARGTVELEFEVKSTVKKPTIGDLNVEISGDLVDDKEYKVATIAEYGVELKADKDDYEFFAGRQEKVVFHLNEIVDDSMINNRTTEFSLPEGVYFTKNSVELKDGNGRNIKYIENKDDQITGFEIDLTATSNKIDKFKFEAKLDITSDFEGDIVLTAEGRSVGEDLETVLAKVKPAIKVTVEPMTVKVGMKEQTGGKIVIEELDKGALQQGKNIILALEKEAGIYITGADVEVVAGDLKIGDVDKGKTTREAITVEVKRKSREASTVELTNIKFKLDRTVPEGAYELKVGGAAISVLADKNPTLYGNDNITAKDFLFVGEKYTKAEVIFTIGSNKFLVNGKEVEMDAAAYIKDGRTMVPVRYLATALGIDTESIKFSAGVVTIFDDARVIQLQTGSKNLVINGMTIPMVAAAEIIEGRTYVPVTEIGSVFGVTGTWDAATQTATFK